ANVRDEWVVHDAALLRHRHALEPLRKSLADVLLDEALAADPAGKPLHRHRPPPHVRKHQRRDGLVVRGQLAFRDPVVWKKHFVWMRDRHGCSLTTSRAALSNRTPFSRG